MREINSVKLAVFIIVFALCMGGAMILRSTLQVAWAGSALRERAVSHTERVEEAIRRTAAGKDLDGPRSAPQP